MLSNSYNEEDEITELLDGSEKQLFNVTKSFIKKKLTPINDILNERYNAFTELNEDPELIKIIN